MWESCRIGRYLEKYLVLVYLVNSEIKSWEWKDMYYSEDLEDFIDFDCFLNFIVFIFKDVF